MALARRSLRVATLLFLVAAAGACTWVPLTPEGEAVELRSAEATESCERLGKTRSRTTTRIGFIARSQAKVNEEQASLARNEAARMGGNAIAPLEPEGGAERSFGIYRCAD